MESAGECLNVNCWYVHGSGRNSLKPFVFERHLHFKSACQKPAACLIQQQILITCIHPIHCIPNQSLWYAWCCECNACRMCLLCTYAPQCFDRCVISCAAAVIWYSGCMQWSWSGVEVCRCKWLRVIVKRQGGDGQVPSVQLLCACVWTVRRLQGWREFAKVRMAEQFFPVVSGMCLFITPTPWRAEVVLCAKFNSQSTSRGSSFLVEMTSKHPHTLTASISLYQRLFVHQHVFPSTVLHVLNQRPEAMSASPSSAGFYHLAALAPH